VRSARTSGPFWVLSTEYRARSTEYSGKSFECRLWGAMSASRWDRPRHHHGNEKRAGWEARPTGPVGASPPYFVDSCLRALPARVPVGVPGQSVGWPLTKTYITPREWRCGSSNVASSAIFSGSKIAMSAKWPNAQIAALGEVHNIGGKSGATANGQRQVESLFVQGRNGRSCA